MKQKTFIAILLAAALLLALTACGTAQPPAASDNVNSTTQPTEQRNDAEPSATEAPETDAASTGEEETTEAASTGEEETTAPETAPIGAEEEAWKTALAEDLLEKYGVIPEYYEDLGDGIYLVYVEIGGEVVPFVTVDSATGEYHG